MLTLADALARARQYDAQFQAAVADAVSGHEDVVQARAGQLPSFSATTQYIGNQSNGVNPNGRFVSMDGVNMYRAWLVLHQSLSADALTSTSVRRARALEVELAARRDAQLRGLAVIVTRAYYDVVTAERKYATAQESATQAQRFLDVAQRQQRLGQVARADVIKAQIQSNQQTQSYREASLALDTARLSLAVLVFPDFSEHFSVVDDSMSTPTLPPFSEVQAMASKSSPEVRVAQAALDASRLDVRLARFALLPSVSVEADYGIEANQFALHSAIAAQPELGVLPNLGYAVTVNLTVPVWDWGGLRSQLRQSQLKANSSQVALTQAQRTALAGLYGKYNEALAAHAAVDAAQQTADLAAESLRLTNLRYGAGESSALEVVDAQNTLVQTRNAADDARARYRVAIAELQTLTGSF
ncbi:MAG: TolC family protein [Vicinamibacterales bacterium]